MFDSNAISVSSIFSSLSFINNISSKIRIISFASLSWPSICIVLPFTFILTFGKTDFIYLRFLSFMPKIFTTSTFDGICFSKPIK